MQVNRLLTGILIILPMMLLGMTLVDVQVSESPAVELTSVAPTPDETEITEPQENSQSTIVIRSNGEWDDDSHQLHTVAYPHFIFSSDDTQIEMFPESLPDEAYLVTDYESGIRFRLFWHGLWHKDVYGVANSTLWIDIKHEDWDEFETWDWVSTYDYEGWGANFADEFLDMTLTFEENGHYEARLNVELMAFLADEEAYRTKSLQHDMTFYVFTQDIVSNDDFSDLQPAFGEMEYNGLFINWQAWNFGPCNLSSNDSAITQQLDEACEASTNQDIGRTTTLLEAILNTEPDDELDAQIRGQLGILKIFDGSWDIASRYLQTALTYWRDNDNANMTANTMHNLGLVYLLSERYADAEQLLVQSATLNSLIDNSIPSWLSWLQLSAVWEDWEALSNATETFADFGLQQADAFEHLVSQNSESE